MTHADITLYDIPDATNCPKPYNHKGESIFQQLDMES